MNQKSVILTLAGLLTLFSAGLLFSHNPSASDTFGKLAFGTLTGLTAYLQVHGGLMKTDGRECDLPATLTRPML